MTSTPPQAPFIRHVASLEALIKERACNHRQNEAGEAGCCARTLNLLRFDHLTQRRHFLGKLRCSRGVSRRYRMKDASNVRTQR